MWDYTTRYGTFLTFSNIKCTVTCFWNFDLYCPAWTFYLNAQYSITVLQICCVAFRFICSTSLLSACINTHYLQYTYILTKVKPCCGSLFTLCLLKKSISFFKPSDNIRSEKWNNIHVLILPLHLTPMKNIVLHWGREQSEQATRVLPP